MNDNLLKRKIIIFACIFMFLVVGGYFLYIYYQEMREETQDILLDKQETTKITKVKEKTEESIKVDIKGEVKKPNIYTVSLEDRIIDVINKAGGLTKNADTSLLNLSKKVRDEMVIIIYSKEQIRNYEKTKELENKRKELCTGEVKNDACIEEADKVQENTSKDKNTGLININTATVEQIQTLPGLGENKAKSIIKYREEHGGFKTIEEIKNVSGIGDSIFDKIKDFITV